MSAQVFISDSSDKKEPNPASILHVNSNNKAFLMPRVNLISIKNPAPFTHHIKGMVVFNKSNSLNKSVFLNDGTKWIELGIDQASGETSPSENTSKIGDIKHSLQKNDHKGWYLLNGRALNSLPTAAQTNAKVLNLSGLPNVNDSYLGGVTGELDNTNFIVSGTNEHALSINNLPALKASGETSEAGRHRHGPFLNSTDFIETRSNRSDTNVVLFGINMNRINLNFTSQEDGNHSHTFNDFKLNNSTQVLPINSRPTSLITNIFIYLGE